MARFTASEIKAIDALWRTLPGDHVWTGWAAAGETPDEIWIFRTRAHWRKFPLSKTDKGYRICDESGQNAIEASSLEGLLAKVEAIPSLTD